MFWYRCEVVVGWGDDAVVGCSGFVGYSYVLELWVGWMWFEAWEECRRGGGWDGRELYVVGL